ncbi:MAG: hypothetical protein H6654_15590 [Ardenticatenaceae bacterium]|nr:hypothetical protein [Anaerolineales bacterium]MCB8939594.1 hypothetical protein [Ardenticatenaceae bacterium]MCB8974981.1 hypothetical protein [Ardenticatenaceae bacterium]
MSIYVLVPILLIYAIYIGVIGTKFSAKVEREKTVRPDLVRAMFWKFFVLSAVTGFLMDLPFKTYGQFTIFMTVMIVGAFFLQVERMKRKYGKEKEE